MCWFDCHRRFLDKIHPYRRNRTNFRSGVVDKRDLPIIWTGHEWLDELDQFGFLRVNEEDAPKHNKEVSKYTLLDGRRGAYSGICHIEKLT